MKTPPAEPDLDHLSEPKPSPPPREPLRRTGKGYRRKYTAKIYTLVRLGLLIPGEELYSTNSRYRATAKITGDGNILYNGTKFLYPTTASKAVYHHYSSQAKAGNGWEFWAVKRPTGYKTLFALREDYEGIQPELPFEF